MPEKKPSKEEAVGKLVSWHFSLEPSLTKVYWFVGEHEGAESEPIKLLEVNGASVTLSQAQVQAYTFGPTDEIPYMTSIAEVSPQELSMIESKPSVLPEGWDLKKARVFDRED